MVEGGRQRTEDRRQKTEDRGQRAEVGAVNSCQRSYNRVTSAGAASKSTISPWASRERLYAGRDGHSLRGCGDAVGHTNIPPSLALVHAQKDGGETGRMVGGCVEQQKIWPQLRDRDRVPAEHQTDPDISGMAAVTGEHGTH